MSTEAVHAARAVEAAPPADVATFHGLTPARLMDTRSGSPTIDSMFAGSGPLGLDGTASVNVTGRGGVPSAGVGAVALNVTVTNPTGTGYLTVFPAGQPRPTASNLNFVPGQTIPNMGVVAVGRSGQISVFNSSGSSDVIVDVLGWFPVGASFTGVDPARLLDTRADSPTIDDSFAGAGPVSANSAVQFIASGRGGVPADGVGAVALNVTVTNPAGPGFLTVYPAGADRPTASNLNFTPGLTIPNMVIVPLGAGGQVSLYNGSGGIADVIVDVLGWFPTGTAFTGLTPARLLDTRYIVHPTIDALDSGGGAIPQSTTLNVVVAGRGGVPATGTGAVALNVTVTSPTGAGYLTVYPSGNHAPTASNLNFVPGQSIPNMVIVPVGNNGEISIYNSAGNSDVIVDVLGWFPNSTDPPTSAGNPFTLSATGIGTSAFGATPDATLKPVESLFGSPSKDATRTFPTFDAPSKTYTADNGDKYGAPFARHVCFENDTFCLDFGGFTADALTFTGFSYFNDPQALLFDGIGLGIDSRPSDFPGAMTFSAGGCHAFGIGMSSTGLYLTLYTRGTPFTTVDAGSSHDSLPAASDVYVTGLFGGFTIQAPLPVCS